MFRTALVGCAALAVSAVITTTPSIAGGDLYYRDPPYVVPPPISYGPPVYYAPVAYPYIPPPVYYAPVHVYYPPPIYVYARPVARYRAYRAPAYYAGHYGVPNGYVSSGYYRVPRHMRARVNRW